VCEVKSISLFIVPELTDEYAQELKLGETVAEMRAKLETDLKKVFDDRNRNRKLEAVLTEIEKNNPFEIPQVLIDEEIRSILVERKFINPKKTDPKKIDVTRFRGFLGSEAETRVRNFIILERIEEQEGFEASDEDVLSFLRSQFGDLNPEALNNFTENPQFLKNERFKAGARRHKVVTLLLEGASFTVVPATTK
jgi:FKBP-type peptidyl-prolyl cis-trans isomerase (trigger factor)